MAREGANELNCHEATVLALGDNKYVMEFGFKLLLFGGAD